MDQEIAALFDALNSKDNTLRLQALKTVLALTDRPMDWVYEVWDSLFVKLNAPNSYQRSIAILVLCNLAKSDTENRLAASLDLVLAHTRDEKFITSRQCLQNIWKVAAAQPALRERVLVHLEQRYADCTADSHPNLIRADILQAFKALSQAIHDPTLLARAQALQASLVSTHP